MTLFDLRRLGKVIFVSSDLLSLIATPKVGQLGMVGTNGTKFPAIRKHLNEKIAQVYADMNIS